MSNETKLKLLLKGTFPGFYNQKDGFIDLKGT